MHLLKTVFFLQPYLCALLNTLLKREGCTESELLIQSKDLIVETAVPKREKK